MDLLALTVLAYHPCIARVKKGEGESRRVRERSGGRWLERRGEPLKIAESVLPFGSSRKQSIKKKEQQAENTKLDKRVKFSDDLCVTKGIIAREATHQRQERVATIILSLIDNNNI